MSDPSRREFLKSVPRTCVLVPLMAQATAHAFESSPRTPQIENDFVAVLFDADTGRLDIWRPRGDVLLAGAVARAVTAQGLRSTSEPAYEHSVETQPVRDRLGDGLQLMVRSSDAQHQLDFVLRVTLYDARPIVLIEADCRNTSSQPVTVERIEPVCALAEQQGALHWPQVTKILTNGAMYDDPGVVADFAIADPRPLRSWWNIGLFRGYDREGLVCGYVENQNALGQLQVRREADNAVSLVAESVLARGFELRPGQTIASGRFMVNIAPDPYAALESYAEIMGRLQNARVHSVLNGWCDWFFAFEHITEDEVLRNAECAARTLRPFGLEYIQVDEGFQRWHGDWEGNEKFPHGMKWLANRIRDLGLKPGIWLAPYVISEPSEVYQLHPDWLMRHPDGRLKRVGPWPSEDSDWARSEKINRYGLDITHPGAADWLAKLFDTVANQWGYEMIKIDFVAWSLLSAERYHDPTVSRASAYRKGCEIMRQAMGPNRHLLDCGPGPVSVGLLDSMRIELDQPPVTWKQYFLQPASSAPAAAKRYYFHKRTWINDADHVCLNLLTLSQSQAAATLLALTGGNLLSGDRLPDLDATRLEILKKIFPAFGEAARPVDLFDTDRHCVFALKLKRSFGEWTVVGIFNISEGDACERVLPLERLWLDPHKKYVAYDFWKERLHGQVQGELRVRVEPSSVTLLAIHEQQGHPQVISTDRHVLQGAMELQDVNWDAASRTLRGISQGPAATAHNVLVYLPEPQRWVQGGPYLYHDFSNYTLKMMNDHLLRVRVRFDQETSVAWEVAFADFFAVP